MFDLGSVDYACFCRSLCCCEIIAAAAALILLLSHQVASPDLYTEPSGPRYKSVYPRSKEKRKMYQ